jgi:hypothetical protein
LWEAKQATQKVEACVKWLRCLHTYLHTADNRLLSVVNIEFFLSIFTHNPLVPGSSPGGPTNSEKATDFLVSGFFVRI